MLQHSNLTLDTTLWQRLTAPHPSITDVSQKRQSRLLASLTLVVMALAAFTAVREYILINFADGGEWLVFWAATIAVFAYIPVYLLNRRGHYAVGAWMFVVLYTALVSIYGVINNEGLFFVTVAILLAAMLLSLRQTIGVAVAIFVGNVLLSQISPIHTDLGRGTPMMFTVYAAALIISYVNHRAHLESERQEELRAANQQLRLSEASLEQRVADRTRDLKVAADVSRQVTTILDLPTLLSTVAERTSKGFGLYHTSVFLYNSQSDTLVLQAGVGEPGEKLKTEGLSVQAADGQGLVSKAASNRTAALITNTSAAPGYVETRYLPLTRSELAVPMLVGDKLVGVLDFQSDKVDRFSLDDVSILTTLAEQIAIAVNNATLYAEQLETTERLRELDNMKSSFLASMSHELRTPLNAILNFSKFVGSGMLGPVNPQQVDALNKTVDSGKHLLSLINDVLDITKIESKMLSLFVEDDLDLSTELETIAATAATLLADKPDVVIVRDIDPALPIISADKRRVRQILLNLVSNACKFTESGTVTISAHIQGEAIRMAVADTGPGIAAEDHDLVFESFRQTKVGLGQGGGTGLGLAIARKLAEAHGGALWLESSPGAGATFIVTLPILNNAPISEMMKAEGA